MGECTGCAAQAVDLDDWCCASCGAPLRTPLARPSRAGLDEGVRGLARYRAWLGVNAIVSLAEPETPVASVDWHGLEVRIKLEGALPTGSFKDRGTAVLFGALSESGVTNVVEDSSGNAGASFAAYSAACGIGLDLFVPASASGAKLAQAVCARGAAASDRGTTGGGYRSCRRIRRGSGRDLRVAPVAAFFQPGNANLRVRGLGATRRARP